MNNSPDPESCRWSAPTLFGGLECEQTNSCRVGEFRIATSQYYKNSEGKDRACSFIGEADYCCEIEEGGTKLCEWDEGNCIDIDMSTRKPAGSDPCGPGKKFATFRKGRKCRSGYEALCCEGDVDMSSCVWRANPFDGCNPDCYGNEVSFGRHEMGGGIECRQKAPAGLSPPNLQADLIFWPQLCCDADDLRVKIRDLLVPLENLFPDHDEILESDKQTFAIQVDESMGGKRRPSGSDDPDANSFGWHIMSGPEEDISSLDKRDGSHWEVFDCDEEAHEGRQTAKMVCTDESDESNCGVIFKGGVPDTVVEMPDHCGPGKYAMAVSLDLISEDTPVTIPKSLKRRLSKRGVIQPRVYNLTFDYGFHRLQGRRDKRIKLRIDYSDNPGYWSEIVGKIPPPFPPKTPRTITFSTAYAYMFPDLLTRTIHVAAAPGSKKSKREIEHEVKTMHSASWERYLDHTWRVERRSTPEHEMDELHKRWFSVAVADWVNRQKQVDLDYDLVRHGVHENVRLILFEQEKECPGVDVYAKIWADLNINVETAAVVTLIGDLTDLASFEQSHATFRNKGDIEVSLNFQADAELRFSTGTKELFGMCNHPCPSREYKEVFRLTTTPRSYNRSRGSRC